MTRRALHRPLALCLLGASFGAIAECGLARAQELYVANASTASITVYDRTATGSVSPPPRELKGPSTGLSGPRGVALDLIHAEMFVTNITNNSVTVYALDASGDTAPLRTIAGDTTLLDSPIGIALDLANDEVIVSNTSNPGTSTNASITVFSRGADGNVAPLRTIAGSSTGLNYAQMLAFDPLAGEILVANAADRASPPGTPSVTVFSRMANGNVAPLRTLSGASTGLAGPIGLALDHTNDEIFVTNVSPGTPTVTVYARTASGDTAPLRTLAGPSTGFNYPVAAFVDLVHQELFVSNQSGNSVATFHRTDSGDTAPIRSFQGTDLLGPGMAVLPAGLTPQTMAVDASEVTGASSNANGVLEAGETVQVAPVWQNTSTIPESFGGQASNLTGPAGPTYTIDDSNAGYATVSGGTTSDCTVAPGGCYLMTVSGARPAQHWDATFSEDLSPAARPASLGLPTKTWTLHVGESFPDVSTSQQFYRFIENLFHNGVTGGCGGGNYCPESSVTRAQMAVFLLKGEHGSSYTPPACSVTLFADVPCPGGQFVDWVNQLSTEGITGGCGGGNYCPTNPVRRDQMAVFLLKAQHGSAYVPPTCIGVFGDVACPSTFADWIEQLAAEQITGGCGGGNYCPSNPNTRGQMAVFLVKTFGLLLYGP
jgi:hypothetical protein